MLATFVAFLLTVRSWGARVVSGQDAMALVIRTRFGLDQILGRGRLDGWLPTFAAGYQEFLFYGPGQTWLIGLSRILTLGQLSDVGGLKVEAIASLALFPLSVGWLATSMGLSKRAAGVAALLSLAVSDPFGVGLHAVFENSLIAQQVAASLVFVAFGAVLRILVDPRRRWALVAGVAVALLVVTHLISTVILALLLVMAVPTLFVTDRLSWRAVRELAIAASVAVGLAAFWLVPLLAHRNLHGPVATWATPALPGRLKQIWHGTFLFRPHVAAVVAVGGLYGLWRIGRRNRYATTLLVVPVGYVLLCRFLLHRYPENEFAIQLENRGLGMAAVIAMFPLAALIADATARLQAVGELAALGLAALVAIVPLGPWTNVAAETAAGTPALHQAAAELRQLVPAAGRFVEVREYPAEIAATGVIHPDFWLAAESGRDTLNVFNPESSSAPVVAFTPDHLLDRSSDVAASDLAQLGVTDVVCTTATCATGLASSSGLHEAWQAGGLTIFSVAGASLLATPGSGSARLVRSDPSHLTWALDFPVATSVTVAVAWSPKWHARIDGQPVRLSRGRFGVLALDLPAGVHRLDVSFRADGWDWLGFLVTVATVGVLGCWVLRRRTAAVVPVPFLGGVRVC